MNLRILLEFYDTVQNNYKYLKIQEKQDYKIIYDVKITIPWKKYRNVNGLCLE